MEPVSVLGIVTISDPRTYIKIKTLHVKNPTEIHGALSDVFGDLTQDRSTVSHWANRFCGDCVSIDNDPIPGRLRTATDKIRLLLAFGITEPQEQKLRRKMHKI